MNLSELLSFHHEVTDLQERVLKSKIHPETAREEIVRLKERWWQEMHNVVDLVVVLAREAKDDDE
jgi:hypothetical protein